jgi:hypothetical protein
MNKNLKLMMLFLVFGLAFSLIISCNLSDMFDNCSKSYNPSFDTFSGKIKYNEYYYNEYYNTKYEPPYIYTEKFIFYEDGKFSYLEMAYEKDTTGILNGKFRIYKDGKYPWHILKLSADSIYKKQMIRDTLSDSVRFSPDFEATKFIGFPTSGYKIIMSDILTDNINRISADSLSIDTTCFDLGKKVFSDSHYCNDGYFSDYKSTFCLKQPEETSEEQNPTGDSL